MVDVYSYEDDEKYVLYEVIKNCFIKVLEGINIPFEIIPSDEGKDQDIVSEEIIFKTSTKNILEIGHLYKLGDVYSKPFGLKNNMSSHGMGIDRLVLAYILSN